MARIDIGHVDDWLKELAEEARDKLEKRLGFSVSLASFVRKAIKDASNEELGRTDG